MNHDQWLPAEPPASDELTATKPECTCLGTLIPSSCTIHNPMFTTKKEN